MPLLDSSVVPWGWNLLQSLRTFCDMVVNTQVHTYAAEVHSCEDILRVYLYRVLLVFKYACRSLETCFVGELLACKALPFCLVLA